MADGINDEELFRHLWRVYQNTIDGRQKYGDVTVLAEAAERMNWPGAPEIGAAIAAVLRDAVVKDKTGKASKHYRNVRDKEIAGLAQIDLRKGITATETERHLAEIYDITTDAVRQIIKRAREEKDADK